MPIKPITNENANYESRVNRESQTSIRSEKGNPKVVIKKPGGQIKVTNSPDYNRVPWYFLRIKTRGPVSMRGAESAQKEQVGEGQRGDRSKENEETLLKF